MATGPFLKRQYLDTGWTWSANSHDFSITAVGATSAAFARIASTANTSGGPYTSSADVNNDIFGVTCELIDTDTVRVYQEHSTATYLGFGLEIWEFIGEVGGANEWIVRAQGEATGDVTGLTGIVDPARCIPFLTGVRSSLTSAAAQEMTGYLTLDPDGSALRWHRGGGGAGTTTYSYAIIEFLGGAWDIQAAIATGLSGASGSVGVTDVGDWDRAFIVPQWAAPDDNGHDQICAKIGKGSDTETVDWAAGTSVSGAALAAYVARNPLIGVQHGTITRSPGGGYFTQAVSPAIPSLPRSGLIVSLSDSDSGSGYVEHAKQAMLNQTDEFFLWSSQGNSGTLEIAWQVIDFGQETTPALIASPFAVAATGGSAAPTVEVSGGPIVATPAAVSALGAVADPTAIVAGLTTITPAAVSALGTVAGPSADVSGLAVITPSPASALGTVADPTAGIAGVPLATPAPASALGTVAAPLILIGGVAPTTAAQDLAAEHVGAAWLALVTIDHADLGAPFRLTSDAVDTTSQGYIFSALPFAVALPDDAEARAPRASLRIDNTSQEIIAALRGLADPLDVTLQIVRASAPDVIEREWTGLEWQASSYDVGFISGQLGVDDMAAEEFPYQTFDSRFSGL